MKRKLLNSLFLSSISLISFGVYAQQQASDYQFGAIVGYNFNKPSNDTPFGSLYKSGSGIRVGGKFLYSITENSKFDFDLILENKKFKVSGSGVTLSYISLLPSYNYTFSDISFSLRVGLRLSLAIDTDLVNEESLTTGLFAGAGYTFDVGNGLHLRPELIYDYMLSDVDSTGTTKSHTLALQVGLLF